MLVHADGVSFVSESPWALQEFRPYPWPLGIVTDAVSADINGDGLQDLLVTGPGLFGGVLAACQGASPFPPPGPLECWDSIDFSFAPVGLAMGNHGELSRVPVHGRETSVLGAG